MKKAAGKQKKAPKHSEEKGKSHPNPKGGKHVPGKMSTEADPKRKSEQRSKESGKKNILTFVNSDLGESTECFICGIELDSLLKLGCGCSICPECANDLLKQHACAYCSKQIGAEDKKRLAKFANT